MGDPVQRFSLEQKSGDALVSSGRKNRSGSQQSCGELADAAVALPPPLPAVVPFTRAPLEDRSKYEKLFSLDDSDPEDGASPAGGRHPQHDLVLPLPSSPERGRRSAKQADEDSIGSATDLNRNVSDDELEDSQEQTLRERMHDVDQSEVGSITVSSSVYHGECDSTRAEEEEEEEPNDGSPRLRSRPKFIRKASAVAVPTAPTILSDDALVGHEFGEKPLLADDELDDDRISSSVTSDKSILRLATSRANQLLQSQTVSRNRHNEAKDVPSGSVEEDVFSLAPFKLPPRKQTNRTLVDLSESRRIHRYENIPVNPILDQLVSDSVFSLDHTTPSPAFPEDLFGLAPFAPATPGRKVSTGSQGTLKLEDFEANAIRGLKLNRNKKESGIDFDNDDPYDADYVIDDIGVSNMSFEDIGPEEANWNPI